MTFLSEAPCPFYQLWYLVFGIVSHSEGRPLLSSDWIFFCVHVYSVPVQQLQKDMWADRRALCFHIVAAKELHNIIRICILFNGFRVFLMCLGWKKM